MSYIKLLKGFKLLLEINNLHVLVEGREILKEINLSIEKGEIIAIMGHNASGKTSLALTIAGFPQYVVSKGKIIFDGRDITNLSIYERARLGIGIAFQSPPAIHGLKLKDMIAFAAGKNPWILRDYNFVEEILRKVNLEPSLYMNRELNVGFSGGERKRSELAQLFAMKPKLMILDEIDSGVDIDSLKILGNSLKEYIEENNCTVMIITHHRHILQYVKPSKVYIMSKGRIVLTGSYEELIPKIETLGYDALIKEVLKNELERKV
ncbi:MAG: Fe-S cluster assembly ATPase SufC [Candidatus Verstraetearchaeota archaeon]|jgi:Fe-S cluster assembly ATP-binding protein|nr:Fe-S cluster assembly ATPase SufC [Candidatus Verstraetearchaeota archaeon]